MGGALALCTGCLLDVEVCRRGFQKADKPKLDILIKKVKILKNEIYV